MRRHFVHVLLFALGAAMTLTKASAQPNQFEPDKGPAACLDPARAKDPECVIDTWASFQHAAQLIGGMYQAGAFQPLDQMMARAMSSPRRFADGSTPAEAVYWAFRQLMRAPGTDPSHEGRIAKWRDAVPGSAFAAFAQARFAYGSAWNIRGNQYASSVSKESWELFHIRLGEAEDLLLGAPQELKDTPIWHQLLLAIVLDMPNPKSPPQSVFENAVKRWSRYFALYDLRLTRMTPKWGGSWRQIDSAIDEWSKHAAATEKDSLYARLYVGLLRQGTADEMALDWKKLKGSFEDLIALYPSRNFKNAYASFACFAKDKPAFAHVLMKISNDQIDPSAWLPGHSYQACMRWAGI